MAGKSDEFFGNHRVDDYWLNGRTRWAQGAQEMARIFADVDLMLVPSLRDEIFACDKQSLFEVLGIAPVTLPTQSPLHKRAPHRRQTL
jgi:hypothetical protein